VRIQITALKVRDGVNNCVNLKGEQHCLLLHATNQKLHEFVTGADFLSWKYQSSQNIHILNESKGIQKDLDSTSSPVRSWKRSLLIAFAAAVVYFCRPVFLIHVYSCAAVNLQANRTVSFPLTSHALENGMAQPNGITQYSHRSYCNLKLYGRHQRKKKVLAFDLFLCGTSLKNIN